ncbi:MAG: DUF4919 domain-containing protein [Alistipes sp.]|nr:DUF4919 domain-containing protein [Alistipes sp.]
MKFLHGLFKYLIAVLLTAVCGGSVFGAVPDNDDIYGKTADASSPYYYPNLKLRFDEWSVPMADDELFYLYYGFAFSEHYRPLQSDPNYVRVMEIMSKIAIEEPLVSDIDELIMAGVKSLEHDPFSPQILNILAYAYGALGDTRREKAYFEKFNGIIRVIESSGDGLREKSPMHIIMFSHALDLIASRGWDYQKSRVISRNVEYVPFDVPHEKAKGFYFDFSRIYWNKPEGYTFKRERTWQFNNLKPREYK